MAPAAVWAVAVLARAAVPVVVVAASIALYLPVVLTEGPYNA